LRAFLYEPENFDDIKELPEYNVPDKADKLLTELNPVDTFPLIEKLSYNCGDLVITFNMPPVAPEP